MTGRKTEIIVRLSLRLLMTLYLATLYIVDRIIPHSKRSPAIDYDILLTGTFYSKNWINSHLYPLAQSKYCSVVRIVSIFPIPESDKIKVIYPPKLLRIIIGNVPARMLTFVWVGIRHRPAFVGGFHLLFNGLVAAFLGRLIQAQSIYFCVGGPAEVLGGGISSENRLFEKLKSSDTVIEQQLINSLKYFNIIITMGTKAVTFFQARGIKSDLHVISGGIDSLRFFPTDGQQDIDLITVGRLEPIKRFDIFIRSIAEIKKIYPNVKAAIIGDGSLLLELKSLTKDLDLEKNIVFPGAQLNVEEWLKRSKIFMLTSDSEGLSLAMMEAMMCGLPAVVSHVGDLGDLVKDCNNGYLIAKRCPIDFATAVLNLLSNPGRLQAFSDHARKSALRFSQDATVLRWNNILEIYAHAQSNIFK